MVSVPVAESNVYVTLSPHEPLASNADDFVLKSSQSNFSQSGNFSPTKPLSGAEPTTITIVIRIANVRLK